MSFYSVISDGHKAIIKNILGMLCLLCTVFILPAPVNALQTALVRTSESHRLYGDVYQIRFSTQKNLQNLEFQKHFSIYDAAGKVKLCLDRQKKTEAEVERWSVVAAELWTAARILSKTPRKTQIFDTTSLTESLDEAAEQLSQGLQKKVVIDMFSEIADLTPFKKLSIVHQSPQTAIIAVPANLIAILGTIEIEMRRLLYAFWIASGYADTTITLQTLANQRAEQLWNAVDAGKIVDIFGGDLNVDVTSRTISGDISIDGPLRLRLAAEVYENNANQAAQLGVDLGDSPDGWSGIVLALLGINNLVGMVSEIFEIVGVKQDLDKLQENTAREIERLIDDNIDDVYELSRDYYRGGFCYPRVDVIVWAGSDRVAEGSGFTYTVFLHSEPDADVTVTISSNNADVTTHPTSLTFTPSNWYEPQTVTVRTAVDTDTVDDRAILSHAVRGYGEITSASQVYVIVVEGLNRTPVAVGSIDVLSLTVGDSAATVDVSPYFSDPDNDRLTYSAQSDDTSVARVSVSGSEVTITPRSEGRARITVIATDPGRLTATQTIDATVQAEQRCEYTLSRTSQAVPPAGGQLQVNVTTTSGCDWRATTGSGFLSLTPSRGTGNGTVTITAGKNTAASSRTGIVTIADQTFTVNQAASSTPVTQTDLAIQSFVVSKTTVTPGESFTLLVTVNNNGPGNSANIGISYYHSSIQGLSPQDQVHGQGIVWVDPLASGANITKSIELNAPSTPGTYYYGAWLVGDTDDTNIYNNVATEVGVTVTDPTRCLYTLGATTDREVSADGESFSVSVTATLGCNWTARANSNFLSVRPSSGTGNGTVRVTVNANSGAERTGTLTIAGQTVTVVQRAHGPTVPPRRTTCDRTQQVIDEILDEIDDDVEDCSDIAGWHLRSITSLSLAGDGITSLQEDDFEDLDKLENLNLSDNSLTSLPEDIFKDLDKLEILELSDNSLTSLHRNIFNGSSRLPALTRLYLSGNSLSSLPEAVFSNGLGALKILDLSDNSLTSLPENIFDRSPGLPDLTELDLSGNSLSSLPEAVFSNGLGALKILDLSDNSLTSLPENILDGLSALDSLDLRNNRLTMLPKGIFDDVLDTLRSDWLEVDASLKATLGFHTTAQNVAEGATVRVTVNLSRTLPVTIRVPYTIGGTTTAADYTSLQPSTELLFLAGETSKEIVFTLLTDADTAAETVELTLGETNEIKLHKSDGSGPDAQLRSSVLLNPPQSRVHTVTVTATGEGVSRPMYWIDGLNNIHRSRLDGTQAQVLVLNVGNPWDIALDISGSKMYWTDTARNAIWQANLDGTGVVSAVNNVSPGGIALDVSGGKMYWTDDRAVKRANLNGSRVEDLVTGLDHPHRIALDLSRGKMYWTDRRAGKIQRANLNGSGVESLVTGLGSPRGIALDISGGKMYWTDSSTSKIQRANLNGSGVEDLVTHINIGADDIELDVSGGKMYWADNSYDKIQRANLDGSQVEVLVTGGWPISVALAIIQKPVVNRAPLAVGTISAQTLTVGGSAANVNVSSNFRDPNNDRLTYTTTSDNTRIATVSVAGAVVTITPKRVGSATVRVIASDGILTATQTISVTVEVAPQLNQAPVTVSTIPAQTLTVGGSAASVNVSSNFRDPDNDGLTYTATSDNTRIATVSVSGTVVTITPRNAGSATVTVTASDGTLTAMQHIVVEVEAAPRVAQTLVKISGDNQQGAPGTTLTNPFIVEVRDAANRGLQGVDVTFVVTAGGGALSERTVTTNASGQASSRLTLGFNKGANTVRVNADGISQTVTFNAVGGFEINIPDSNLRAKVERALNKRAGDPITAAEMATLTSLNAGYSKISDLAGLKFAINLTKLNVYDNRIAILPTGVFEGLNKVTELYLRRNPLTTIKTGAFNGLSSLQSLDLSYMRVATIEGGAFNGLSNLQSLNLYNNSIKTLPTDAFKGLNKVTELYLRRNPLTTIKTGAFNGLSSLQSLDLSYMRVATIEGGAFNGLSNLQSLNLYNNSIKTLPTDAFKGLNKVTELYLRRNPLTTIKTGAFNGLSSLQSLDLSYTRLVTIEGGAFKGLSNLQSLNLYNNNIKTLPTGVFEGLSNLTSLRLNSNPGTPFTLVLELVRTDTTDPVAPGPATVVVQLAQGAPLEVTLDLSVERGTLSAATATIERGKTQSDPITMTQSGRAPATVSMGAAPRVPRVYYGLRLAVGDPLSTGAIPPHALNKISGDNQEGPSGATLAEPFIVEVQDAANRGLEGVDVTFAIIAGSGTLNAITVTTDANGQAESWFTLGNQPGTNTVRASVEGLSQIVTFNVLTKSLIFDLTVSAGTNLIHVPLRVTAVDGVATTLDTIGDLYDALGSTNAVNFLMTYDTSIQDWRSYFSNTDRGTANDKTLTDAMGIIAGLKAPTSVRLTGKPLGNNGSSTISLNQGLNLVGLPLRDSRISRVSDLLSLKGIRGNVPVILVTVNGDFTSVGQAGDPADVPITGGQGFMLTAQRATTVALSGEPWTNGSATAAAPKLLTNLPVGNTTPVLALKGEIVDEVVTMNPLGFRVAVRNLSTDKQVATTAADAEVGYRLTVVDIETMRAARVGDVFEITAQSTNPFIGVKPLRYAVTAEDVLQGWIQLPSLVAYEIPTETELLANYPNPFNPETWIPYRLAEDADVKLTIYDGKGRVVRTLNVGYRVAAVYESRSKAIYWDGRNNLGEQVASGVYFYHLLAGDYSQTRKMLIVK